MVLAAASASPLVSLDGSAAAATDAEAIRLRAGSVTTRQVVALGRDLVIEGEALQNAAVLGGDARIEGRVAGDVVALGGSVVLGNHAVVGGDVYALGGQVDGDAGASVRGRVAAYPDAPTTLLVLMEGPALGLGSFSGPVLTAKAAVLLAWIVSALLLALLGAESALERTAALVRSRPLSTFFAGTVAVASVLMGLVLFSAFAAPVVGVPLAVVAVLVAVALKVWGTVAIFGGIGRQLAGRSRGWALPTRLAVGVMVLGAIKFLPFVGTVVWSAVTFSAVGAALLSRFGQLDP